MQRPRQPVTAPTVDTSAPAAVDSPSGFWPLGFFERAKILNHSVGRFATIKSRDRHERHAGLAENTTDAQRAIIQQSLNAVTDPMSLFVGMFANAPIGCTVLKSDGHVLISNSAAQRLLGDALPSGCNAFTNRVTVQYGIADAAKRALNGETVTLPAFWREPADQPNPSLPESRRTAMSVTAFPIANANHVIEHVAITYRDDTEVMQAQLRLQAESEQLEQHILNRTCELEEANEELEAFTYSVSHDLRAPLRAIDSFAALLTQDRQLQLSDESTGYLGRIRAATTRMSDLINDLLAFSRLGKQALKPKAVAPSELVRQVLEELEPKMRGRALAIHFGNMPECQADPSLLREVFLNLLDNAIKFTGKRTQARIEVGARIEDDQLVWYVADNGVGFDMAHYDRLFGVFSRLHSVEEFEGTGVGLALVQRIVKRHGGAIWAKGDVGKGATFYFTLGQ